MLAFLMYLLYCCFNLSHRLSGYPSVPTSPGHYLSVTCTSVFTICSWSVCLSVCEGESVPFQTLADLAVGEESCIVGTLFKRMDLKPSILKAITHEVSQQVSSVCLTLVITTLHC